MLMRAAKFAVSLLMLTACGEDPLRPIVVEPCVNGETRVDGVCPIHPGNVTGIVCDDDGYPLSGLVAAVEADGAVINDITDSLGRFRLTDVPAGDRQVVLESASMQRTHPVTILPGVTVHLGPTVCRPGPGELRGRVCDPASGGWAAGATVSLDDEDHTTTVTDSDGRYAFEAISPGDYIVSYSWANGTDTYPATVTTGGVTELDPVQCNRVPGSLSGRICAGNEYWLAGADVTIALEEGGSYSTVTDGDGYFQYENLPDGTHTVTASRGSFSVSFDVQVYTGEATVLDPVCIPPTTKIAVVTGIFDEVESVLGTLGFPVKDVYDSAIPETRDPDGNVDLIYGRPASSFYGDWPTEVGSHYWIRDFLSDPVWMAEYDIIFINCGANDADIDAGAPSMTVAMTNLQNFVAGGGSVWVSDWASEMLRTAFPGRINFLGNDGVFGAARQGVADSGLPTTILDDNLEDSLGQAEATISVDLDWWVMMDTTAAQPSDLHILVEGDAQRYTGGVGSPAAAFNDTPLVVHFDHGDGRVLFTSAHLEWQTTDHLQHILNYTIFEL